MIETTSDRKKFNIVRILLLSAGFAGIIGSRFISYLLFHSLVELFSVIIAAAIFLLVWNTREHLENSYLLVIGLAMVPIASLDLVHMLAYKGMNIFPGTDANLPTQLWIAARSFQACVMIIAPFLLHRKIRSRAVLAAFISVTILLLGFIFLGLYPDCYIEGQGLTRFKITSEYIISAVLLLSAFFLYRNRTSFTPSGFTQLISATAAMIISEIAFTFYVGVFDLSNYIGHIFKIIAFWFFYKALVEDSLKKPVRNLVYDLKQSEQALSLEKVFNTAVFDTLGALVVVMSEDGSILRINRMFEKQSQVIQDMILGRKLWELPYLSHSSSDIRLAFQRVKSSEGPINYTASFQTRTGHLLLHQWTNTVITSSNGEVEFVIAIGIDISRLKAVEEELRYLSNHDPLTKVYNRAFFETELARLEQSRLYPISIIVADLDQLKQINDRSGHSAGDAALQNLARLFTSVLRKEDIIARIGGDEFVVLLPHTNTSEAEKMISRIQNAHQERAKPDTSWNFSFSIGFATAEEGHSLQTTLDLADKAMYLDKHES